MKRLLVIIAVAIVGSGAFSQAVVYIPDKRFKAALLADKAINTTKDGEISIAEATAYKGAIRVQEKRISDLTGIEAFVNITELKCCVNELTSLDVSKNIFLESLLCARNQLTTLDVSSNVELKWLYCPQNRLTTLDVSSNTKLVKLRCTRNRLTCLDLSNNTRLVRLVCARNKLLKSLNVKNGHTDKLKTMLIHNNPVLNCLQVDDADAFKAKRWWLNRDIISEDCFADSEDCFADEVTGMGGIGEGFTKDQLIIYPNPATNVVTINTSDLVIEEMSITSAAGGRVKMIDKDARHVDISSLSSGTYLVKVKTATGTIFSKFLKINP